LPSPLVLIRKIVATRTEILASLDTFETDATNGNDFLGQVRLEDWIRRLAHRTHQTMTRRR
jgi:hypothetical protein